MKNLLLISFFLTIASLGKAQDIAMATNVSTAEITWEDVRTFDFGQIATDEAATHIFKFTNTGSEALIISSAKASCGCTVAGFTNDPIPAGGAGEITVSYNAKKPGHFQKSITVISNAKESPVMLYLKGEVKE